MPVQKFRSIEEARKALRVEPATLDHARAVRSVFGIASLLGPARRLPPGVYKFRSVEEAQRQRRVWRPAP
jgi:hypothetical protein